MLEALASCDLARVLDRYLQSVMDMRHVKVTFRGIKPEESLVASVRRWVQTIREGLPRSSQVEADVLIERCSPEWGSSTTVRAVLCVDGRETIESARSQEAQSAVQECFAALGRVLGRRALELDAMTTGGVRAPHAVWGPKGTF